MIIAEYNLNQNTKKKLKLLDNLELKKSSQEVQFSSLKADYTGGTKEELPYTYQEIRIWEVDEDLNLENGNLLFTGFLDEYTLPKMVNENDDMTLEISLLSPMQLATNRYVSANGIYMLSELLEKIFQPLVDDGFELKEINITDIRLQVNYFIEAIETIANDLSNKCNFYWYIDEHKYIYVISIQRLLSRTPKLELEGKVNGLYGITPKVEANNYFNTINVKNVRVYCAGIKSNGNMTTSSSIDPVTYSLLNKLVFNNGDEITFENPIDFSITGIKNRLSEGTLNELKLLWFSNDNIDYIISYSDSDGKISLPSGVVYSDEDTSNATIILQRDSFFNELITGFKWNGSKTSFDFVFSDMMLKYQTFKILHSEEIEKCKGIISNTGIIETMIDLNETWYIRKELIEYCRNLMSANGNQTTDVTLEFDKRQNLSIGDLVSVNMPEFMTAGTFIITAIKETEYGNDYNCKIELKNSKITSNFIDLFRNKSNQNIESKYNIINLVELNEDNIIEKYEVIS